MIMKEGRENGHDRGTLVMDTFVMFSNDGRSENSGNFPKRPSYSNTRRNGKYNSYNRDRRSVSMFIPLHL